MIEWSGPSRESGPPAPPLHATTIHLVPHLAAVLVATAVVVGRAAPPAGDARAQAARSATIAYAVDGDTLRVSLGSRLEYVRLVGIDTPEDVQPGTGPECGSLEAAASMERLAPEGARVRLRFDSVADHRDRYGRLLAHAFVAGRQLEVAQLRRGWATVYRFDDQQFDGLVRFERAEAAARTRLAGVWGACGGGFHSAS
jgi:micrococcal nuclease